MVRWHNIIPRIALFVLFVGFSTLALNPLVRWGIVRTGESVTGSVIDVARVRSALTKGYITMDGVEVAHSRNPMKNMFEADHVRLDVDTKSLRQRRFVVTHGQVEGLRLGTDRTSSAILGAKEKADYVEQVTDRFATNGQAWFQSAVHALSADETERLQSIALSRQLAENWPQAQAHIDERSTYVRDRITQIQQLIDQSGENPLRNMQPYKTAIAELEVLQKEAVDINGGMNRMRQQLLMDKTAIEQARKQDETFVAQMHELAPMDGQAISNYLVGPELNDQVEQVLDWVRWGRKQVPAGAGIPLTRQGRGENLFFHESQIAPQTVLNELALKGFVDFADESVSIEGIVRGLSSNPKLASAPVEMILNTTSGGQLSIQALLDSRGDQSHDHVLINCPNLPAGERTLGDPRRLAVAVSPGVAQMWVRMEVNGEQVTGEVIIKQKNVTLTPQLDPKFAGDQISQLAAAALAGVDRIETRAQLSGTVDETVCQLESSLGADLASGLALVITNRARERQMGSLVSTYADVDAMIARLDLEYERKNQELLTQLDSGREQIEQIKQIIATRVEKPDGLINKDSPLRETFLR